MISEKASKILKSFANGLIVSCQASTGEPLAHPDHIVALSLTVLNGGACALRLEGVENIRAVRAATSVPIVGITKIDGLSEAERLDSVYITATFDDARNLKEAGADVIAMDATARPRPDGMSLEETIHRIHHELEMPVWADTATFEEAQAASAYGADIISTTLFGYTRETYRDHSQGPDFDFLSRCVKELGVPVILEGRVWQHEEAARALELGAHAVVVGSAITRPHLITKGFVEAMEVMQAKKSGSRE
jgi:N-acylglucosamine-6-phosphate 2-epimerase